MIGTLGISLFLGHLAGDFAIQQHTWSARKAELSLHGQTGMALHVLSYTAACWLAVYAGVWIDGLHIDHGALAIGMAVNAATHWILDLRTPLAWLIRATGHGGWLDADPKVCMFVYDQVTHLIILLLIAFGVAAS